MENSGDKWASLFKKGEYINFSQGEVLHGPEEKCRSLGRVEKGLLRLARFSTTGKEIVIRDFLPGEIYGELIVFTGAYYPGWLRAVEESSVIEAAQADAIEYLKNSSHLLDYLSSISEKVSSLSETIEILSLKTIRQRIAFILLYGQKNTKLNQVKASRLPAYTGCSREAVSRILSEMEHEGIILKERGIVRCGDTVKLENLL